jgi:hypothetical protein
MNQKSSLRENPQFVSTALTANKLGTPAAQRAYGYIAAAQLVSTHVQ